MEQITLRQAYDKGYATGRHSHADWDDALVRFSQKFCAPHDPVLMCDLEHSWADGFDDSHDGPKVRRPAADATKRVRVG